MNGRANFSHGNWHIKLSKKTKQGTVSYENMCLKMCKNKNFWFYKKECCYAETVSNESWKNAILAV